MFDVYATYEVVTPESAELGDTARAGWTEADATEWEYTERPDAPVRWTARELYDAIQGGHASCGTICPDGHCWVTVSDGETRAYFEDGEDRSVSFHLAHTASPSVRRHWATVLRLAGV